MASVNPENENVLYEPDEKPPHLVTLGVGAQSAAIMVTRVVVTVVIVARIAEQPESYISWGVFAALVVSGVITVLQAVKVGRVGAGHVGGVHSRMRRSADRGGPRNHGESHPGLIPVSDPAGFPTIAA